MDAATNMMRRALGDLRAKLAFAPLWIPVPRFHGQSGAENTVPVPTKAYAIVWQPQWQKEIGLSAEQQKKLTAINSTAMAEVKRHTEQFGRLSPEAQKAQVESWGGKPAPWTQQLDNEVRKQIEAVLTPGQLQAIQEFAFPSLAVALLYDATVRRETGFGPQQEDQFRRVVREKLARSQQVSLERAEKVWGLLTPQQQAKLPQLVKEHGPTSKVLSLAYEVGFDIDAMAGYPMLAQAPVRKRLKLSAEQENQLQAVMADAAARSRKVLQGQQNPDSQADDRGRVEAILTPQQLTTLDETNFRREVVLVLGYPEKRQSIGMTDQQMAGLEQLDKDTHEQLYRIDREMLAKALEILSPRQREQLRAEIDRRGAW
jgi:hypothetical protein